MNTVLPTPAKFGFYQIQRLSLGGMEMVAWAHRCGLRVLFSVEDHGDGRDWLHASMDRTDRLPSYNEMKLVKKVFIGDEREAYQIFARADEHVNLRPNCLHLWALLEGRALPDSVSEATA